MPKRSVDKPHLRSKYEKARVTQSAYGQMIDERKKINPIFLERPHYGIPEPGKGVKR